MKYTIDNITYDVLINRKRRNKGTYIRIKDENTIYVTTNYLVPNFEIKRLIKKNEQAILKMINIKAKENKWNNNFYYLGKQYEVINTNNNKIEFIDDKVYLGKIDIDSFYKKEAKKLYQERLDYWYNSFSRKIPKPKLFIRKMKTRWGVCNVKTKRITLNLELIKKDKKYLDYVVVHELSHLIHHNHGHEFWSLVGRIVPNYKELRKELNNYE